MEPSQSKAKKLLAQPSPFVSLERIKNLIAFLAEQQQTDGSFLSCTSARKDFKNADSHHTTFFTSLILGALNCAFHDKTSLLQRRGKIRVLFDGIRRRASEFLIAQASRVGSYNYWARGSSDAKKSAYPDDLDDTVLALYALQGFNPRLLTPKRLATLTRLLIANATDIEGPYRTWLVRHDHSTLGADVDAVVNANILALLEKIDVHLPGLEKYLLNIVKRSKKSLYYPSGAMFYTLSRVASKTIGTALKERLLRQTLSHDMSFLLMINAKAHVGEKIASKDLQRILSMDHFRPYAFGVEKIKTGISYYSGCSAFTAALALEFFIHADSLVAKGDGSDIENEVRSQSNKRDLAIHYAATHTLSESNKEFGEKAREYLETTLSIAQQNNILALPYHVAAALKRPLKVDSEFLERIAIAGFHGWIGYTLLDHVLDQDRSLEVLPYAQTMIRSAYATYMLIERESNLEVAVSEIFISMEEAIAWEQVHCYNSKIIPRYGDYDILAKRSLGHAIGPLLVLAKTLRPDERIHIVSFRNFFSHYLIARQLSDDAHDWRDDFDRGRINSVSAILLSKKSKGIQHIPTSADLNESFWKYGIQKIANEIVKHIGIARQYLQKLEPVLKQEFFEGTLKEIEKEAQRAVKERAKTLEFLEVFRS